MAAARPRRRATGRLHSMPDPAKFGPLLREAGFIGTKEDPIECRAWFDPDGTPRRVFARYPGGWTCTVTLRADGTVSSFTQGVSLRVTGKKAAK